MKHYFGLMERDLTQRRIEKPVIYSPSELINAHMLICGMTGVGKSTQAMSVLSSAAKAGMEIDVFDSHDEFQDIPNAAVCGFSQETGYGYNPLILDTDLHTGGVNNQVDFFIRLIKQVTPQFGVKQEGALRNLLIDTYATHNITHEDRSSWHKKSISEPARQKLLDEGRGDELVAYYPTLEDLMAFAKEKIIALTIGADNKCVTAFEFLCRVRKKLDSLMRTAVRISCLEDELAKLNAQIEDQKQDCVDSYVTFIKSMTTGREIDDILKYDSVVVLTSVLQRVRLLGATGILSANEPPFGRSNVRVHQIKNTSNDQQILYVKLRLQAIFDECKRMDAVAPGSPPRRIVMIDEAHKYFSNDHDDVLNVIAKEGRKFGIGLWCASQEPTAFPESFLSNCGATIVLGIAENYWKRAATLFRISEGVLLLIKPKEVMAVKLLKNGCAAPPFTTVVVPNPGNPMGVAAIKASTKSFQGAQHVSVLDDDEDC